MPPPATATTTAPANTEKARLVEEILRPQQVFYDIADAFSGWGEGGKRVSEEFKAKKEAEVARLMALALSELQAMRANQIAQAKAQEAARIEAEKRRKTEVEQKAAQKEAAKFYNQASAKADFSYWATMDYWSFDEALALLLGKDPRVLTRSAMKRELAPEFSLLALAQPQQRPKSELLRRYEDLRSVAERAAAMKPAQLRPVDVVLWAGRSGATTPPEELVQALLARAKRSQPKESQSTQTSAPPKPDALAVATIEVAPTESEPTPHPGTPKRWDAEALRELETKRRELGTAKAAKHFGITAARVRQLLPQEKPTPTASNPFNLGLRK
ncbi:MAG: hypothetical protein A2Z93_04965 [Curvibacter sp. GWA2_64_110]|nr:MAG: hypothetical protein A2Z93_04965 [Curvibacter sp. GWA2_64_110]HCY16917.1 hypothetical protein [Curvibacter sp.]